jgi:hypothetical protein
LPVSCALEQYIRMRQCALAALGIYRPSDNPRRVLNSAAKPSEPMPLIAVGALGGAAHLRCGLPLLVRGSAAGVLPVFIPSGPE